MPARPTLPVTAPAAAARWIIKPSTASRASLTTTATRRTTTTPSSDSRTECKRPVPVSSHTRPIYHVATTHTDPKPPSVTRKQDNTFETIPNTSIRVLRTIDDVRQWTSQVASVKEFASKLDKDYPADQGVALVPTMGALHAGHTDLIVAAAAAGHTKIVVSIYVNPAQFGAAEDLDTYPQTWDADCATLAALLPTLQAALNNNNTTTPQQPVQLAVFAPTTPELYPSGFPGQHPDSKGSFVTITPLSERLEGTTRPTFFRGVATVCMKLFHIVQPARVFFGQKDIQQTVVLRRMLRDFCMPIALQIVPTHRDRASGLALSSRNVYLGPRRAAVAPVLIRALRAAEAAYLHDGAREAGELIPEALGVVLDAMEAQKNLSPREGVVFKLEYISLADPDTMEELESVDPARGAILSGAVRMMPLMEAQEGEDVGKSGGPMVRLIDNIILPPVVDEGDVTGPSPEAWFES